MVARPPFLLAPSPSPMPSSTLDIECFHGSSEAGDMLRGSDGHQPARCNACRWAAFASAPVVTPYSSDWGRHFRLRCIILQRFSTSRTRRFWVQKFRKGGKPGQKVHTQKATESTRQLLDDHDHAIGYLVTSMCDVSRKAAQCRDCLAVGSCEL